MSASLAPEFEDGSESRLVSPACKRGGGFKGRGEAVCEKAEGEERAEKDDEEDELEEEEDEDGELEEEET